MTAIIITIAFAVGYIVADFKNFLKIEKLKQELNNVDDKYRAIIRQLKNINFTSKD